MYNKALCISEQHLCTCEHVPSHSAWLFDHDCRLWPSPISRTVPQATALHCRVCKLSALVTWYASSVGLSEAMLRPGSWTLGDKGTHYIRTIKNSSNHLATLINDILDAASMAKGKLVIKQETVRLLLYFAP